ncbi:hypothetical protein CA265_20790 [Sphingobacteriaceae bacterium GW460-11-11-14-LB5]|nr:hypothetical protein CA265_20790 [Sphingobacteriaceae bacterium GW460-11-11-14-LB5]
MNDDNLTGLKNTLDRLGFGNKLNEVMESAIRNQTPSFLLGICSYFDPPVKLTSSQGQKDFVQYILNFGRSQKTGDYRLFNYLAELSTHNGVERKQGFEINSDHYVTAKDAYYLLLGNSVLKEVSTRKGSTLKPPEKTDVWLRLNLQIPAALNRHPLSKFYPPHGFSVHNVVDKYPIFFQHPNDKATLINALKKGMLPKADMLLGCRLELVYLSINPKMKNLDVFDQRMNTISNDYIFQQIPLSGMPQRIEFSNYTTFDLEKNTEKANEAVQGNPVDEQQGKARRR